MRPALVLSALTLALLLPPPRPRPRPVAFERVLRRHPAPEACG